MYIMLYAYKDVWLKMTSVTTMYIHDSHAAEKHPV